MQQAELLVCAAAGQAAQLCTLHTGPGQRRALPGASLSFCQVRPGAEELGSPKGTTILGSSAPAGGRLNREPWFGLVFIPTLFSPFRRGKGTQGSYVQARGEAQKQAGQGPALWEVGV